MRYAGNMGETQRHVLKNLRDDGHKSRPGSWYASCGWYWGSENQTIKIMEQLADRGYAVCGFLNSSPNSIIYTITPAGRLALEAPENAGRVELLLTEKTGTHVGVYDGGPAGMDIEAGRWQTVCEEHGGIISHIELQTALDHAPFPEEWCDHCIERERYGEPVNDSYNNAADDKAMLERFNQEMPKGVELLSYPGEHEDVAFIKARTAAIVAEHQYTPVEPAEDRDPELNAYALRPATSATRTTSRAEHILDIIKSHGTTREGFSTAELRDLYETIGLYLGE